MKKDELINAIDKISMSELQKNSIYETVMTEKKHTRKSSIKQILPKVAGIVLAVGVLGAGTVYAANYIFNKISVSDHVIYPESGHSSIIDEIDSIMDSGSKPNDSNNLMKDTSIDDLIRDKMLSLYQTEELSKEEPGPNDKWFSKSIKQTTLKESQEVINYTEMTYPDHNTMIEDTGLENIYSDMSNLTQVGTSLYEAADLGSSKAYSAIEAFNYKNTGSMFVNLLIDPECQLNGLYYASTSQLSDKRTYLSKTGIEFTLANSNYPTDNSPYNNSIIATSSFGKYSIIINTDAISEDDLHEFLDTLSFAMD